MVLIGMVLQLTPGLFLLEGLTVTSVGGWLTFAWVVLLGGEVARFFRDAFPQLPPVRAVAGWTGTITYTPDGRPLIGPVLQRRASGCSPASAGTAYHRRRTRAGSRYGRHSLSSRCHRPPRVVMR
jgi:hypothetical protein